MSIFWDGQEILRTIQGFRFFFYFQVFEKQIDLDYQRKNYECLVNDKNLNLSYGGFIKQSLLVDEICYDL